MSPSLVISRHCQNHRELQKENNLANKIPLMKDTMYLLNDVWVDLLRMPEHIFTITPKLLYPSFIAEQQICPRNQMQKLMSSWSPTHLQTHSFTHSFTHLLTLTINQLINQLIAFRPFHIYRDTVKTIIIKSFPAPHGA